MIGIEIREVRDLRNLRALLRLRFELMRQGRFHRLVPPNASGVDIDRHDLRSRHIGFYPCGSSRPVGYMRGVGLDEGPAATAIRVIAATSGLQDQLESDPGEAFPFPASRYLPSTLRLELCSAHEALRASGDWLGEASRFCIRRESRTRWFVARVVDAVVALFVLALEWRMGFAIVDSRSGRLYEQCGFVPLGPFRNHVCRTDEVALTVTRRSIPEAVLEPDLAMAREYRRSGRILLNPLACSRRPVSMAFGQYHARGSSAAQETVR